MSLLGRLHALVFLGDHRRMLGMRQSAFVIWLPTLAALVWTLAGGDSGFLMAGVLASLTLATLRWLVRRGGYLRFMPEATVTPPAPTPLPLEAEQTLRASGRFSLSDREDELLLQPARLWRVALGDHVVMVSVGERSYRYEFVNRGMLERLEAGRLAFGARPQLSLAVTFRSGWGPRFAAAETTYTVGRGLPPPPALKTIYLTFSDASSRERVWASLLAALADSDPTHHGHGET